MIDAMLQTVQRPPRQQERNEQMVVTFRHGNRFCRCHPVAVDENVYATLCETLTLCWQAEWGKMLKHYSLCG